MKSKILRLIRTKPFQPLWEKMFHYSKIGMNLYGGAAFSQSGEIEVLKYSFEKIQNKEKFILFDVGACLGEYAEFVCNAFSESVFVYSFEPSKLNFKKLSNAVKKKEHEGKLFPVNVGFGDKDEDIDLNITEIGEAKHSIYDMKMVNKSFINTFKEKITLTTIDKFCIEKNIQKIDYLKLDIEGHELFALKGASQMIVQKKIKHIQFEFSECNIASRTYFKDFYDLLSPNYNLYRIVSNGIVPISAYSTDLEIFHITNYLAELKSPE